MGGRADPRALAIGLLLVLAPSAAAHHVLGIPHYARDPGQPGVSVLQLREVVGRWTVRLTASPGHPAPGQSTRIEVTIHETASRRPYTHPLVLRVRRSRAMGLPQPLGPPQRVAAGTMPVHFTTRYPEVGNYLVELSLEDGPRPSTLQFSVVIGQPGRPWLTLGLFVGGLLVFIVGIRAVRIKRARHMA